MHKFLHRVVKIEKIKNKNPEKEPIVKVGEVRRGFLNIFGVGAPLFMTDNEGYFITSTIKSIDEEKGLFETRNSTYSIITLI